MKLAFYYHIPVVLNQGSVLLPSYLGVFVDSLANEVETLYLVAHQARPQEAAEADYRLKAGNIVLVDLGLKTPAWHRDLFHKKILKTTLKQIEACDVFLVRSPTPLSPYFKRYLNRTRLVYLVVGDYAESVEQTHSMSLRSWMINQYLLRNDNMFRKAMRSTDVIVNSPALYKKYAPVARSIGQIKTTTLSAADFYERTDTCLNPEIRILFTGRIDPLKGLFELLEAFSRLISDKVNASLHIVGWETDPQKPVEKQLREKAEALQLSGKITFHGRKTVGPELNEMYRMGDIYTLPSHEEGFPRTIWEAMANALPVIATTVGAIPEYLTNGVNAFLISPKQVDQLYEAITRLIGNPALRQQLIRGGKEIARENTLEIQSQKLVAILKQLIHE